LAVLGVMAYHLGFGWASGGYLGVDLFFVLSGFLITSLLLEEWGASARIRLGAFWGRRARRLLPALFLVLIAVALYAVVNGQFSSPTTGGAAIDLEGLRGDALATLLYVANWHAIFAHQSYFAQFSTPSPLQHTWSLAIEEQFYLVWPLVIVGLLKWSPRRWRSVGLGLCVTGALASATAMAVLYHPGGDPSRVYYGTDTRAFDLLAGAAVAFVVANRPQPGPRARALLHGAAIPALAILAVFWFTAGTASGMPTTAMFWGGFLGCAVLAAVVIADVRQFDRGALGAVLAVRPLGWIGTISYGLYLWHWPIYVYLNSTRTGLSGAALDIARVALTFAVAVASYYVVERPIRRRKLAGSTWRLLAPAAAVATVVVVIAGTAPSVAAPPQPAKVSAQGWKGGGLDPGPIATVAGVGGFSHEAPIVLPRGVVISGAHRLRVMTIGDSIMTFAHFGIETALQSTGEVKTASATWSGFGLTVPGSSDEDRATMQLPRLLHHVRAFRPQLLIGTWLWDGAAAEANPSAYQAILDTSIRQLFSAGSRLVGIVLLQMPDLDDATLQPGVPAWNRAAEESAKVFPGKVMYLPVGSSLAVHGHYSSWLPPLGKLSTPRKDWVRVRTSDGVHLCPPGITRYAGPVLADLTKILHLPPGKPGWWNSRPVRVQALLRLNKTEDVTCPTDHPPA